MEILFPAPKEARGEAEGRRRGKKLLPVGAIFSLKKPVFLFLKLGGVVRNWALCFVFLVPGVGFSTMRVGFSAMLRLAFRAGNERRPARTLQVP